MKISIKTDYALRILLELAVNYEVSLKEKGCLKMKEISKKHNIPYKFLQQIVLLLKRLGYIKTTQGIKGGVCLAKHPKDIKLLDVIKDLEGETLPIVCFEKKFSQKCKETNCVFIPIWQEIDKKVKEVINDINFEELVKRYYTK
ncbi:MAG: Rrf2 family transcriptional regulator, partial [Endomicrobia bacterium]|nr:Rrf2 family transcriptional regulator [Endomicrobiia bacterium]